MSVGVAVVGLGFGEAFLPIYQRHPDVGHITIVDADPARLAEVGDRHRVTDRATDLDAVLNDPRVDAVHLLTPVAFHARQSIAALTAGRHCACAVPMAMSLEDLGAVRAAAHASGRVYMMMETSVYAREYHAVERLHRSGELGAVTFYRGFHIQNLDGFAAYWRGYPPMAYVTHALSPILALLDTTVTSVHCLGSGRLTGDREGSFGNPYPLEAGLFRLRGSDAVAEVTMAFHQTARAYTEGFCVYGDRTGIEWPSVEGGPLTRFDMTAPGPGQRGNPVERTVFEPADHGHLLPREIAGFAAHRDAHGGSHPHLVHEFVRSIVEGRPSRIDADTAAAWTAPGIVAHEAAMRGGVTLDVPDYRR
ncbi:oxidoreductase [Catellatospora methionotrophica]|uniref:Oxidoreductase n=1 Tax=Catellatospora methionotrophica TaxID=121620 RepID=A0A8J3LQT6_9ACTN|nr:Gfo/Idh/MocA family oxidoreductase [Catellatospora methionotrophica]GIG17145.1 oxidoreductase [Catellatospora methionotrophica]